MGKDDCYRLRGKRELVIKIFCKDVYFSFKISNKAVRAFSPPILPR